MCDMKNDKSSMLKPDWMPSIIYGNNINYPRLKYYFYYDGPDQGIGDTIEALLLINHLGLNPLGCLLIDKRAAEFIKKYNYSNNFQFSECYLSGQKFKEALVSTKWVSKTFSRLLLNFYIFFKRYKLTSMKILVSDINKVELNCLNYKINGFSLVSNCARQNSRLSSSHIGYICRAFNPNVIDHLNDINLIKLRNELSGNNNNNYFGYSVIEQFDKSSDKILIAVASSLAKINILMGCPVVLILFQGYNTSFDKYFKFKNPVFSFYSYSVYHNANLVVILFHMTNTTLKNSDLESALHRAIGIIV